MGKAKELIASIPREKPSFTLDAKALPSIKYWKVGKKYKILLHVEMVTLSKNEWGKDDNQIRGRFTINSSEDYSNE